MTVEVVSWCTSPSTCLSCLSVCLSLQGASLGLQEDEEDEEEEEVVSTFERMRVTSTGSRSSWRGSKRDGDLLTAEWQGRRLTQDDKKDSIELRVPDLKLEHKGRSRDSTRSSDKDDFRVKEKRDGSGRRRQAVTNSQSLTPRSGSSPQQRPIIRTNSDQPPIKTHVGVTDMPMNNTLADAVSEETLVSSSLQDIHQASSRAPSSPQMRNGKGFTSNQRALEDSTSQQQDRRGGGRRGGGGGGYASQQGAIMAASAAIFTPSHSQDSFMDGLSPDTSDTGEPSAETDSEPREIEIAKGSAPLGE